MSKLWLWASLGLAAALAVQTNRIADLKKDLAKAESAQAKEGEKQAQQAQVATKKEATALLDHAGNTQDNVYEYTQKIQQLEAGRAADAGRITGLQHSLRTVTSARDRAAGDLAACRALADRHEQLGELAARSAGLVGRFVQLVEQRDAEVNVLHKQVQIERQLVQQLLNR